MKFIYTLILCCCMIPPAAAQFLKNPSAGSRMACAERTAILRKLANNFNEAQIAIGLGDGGRVIEVFVSPSGSFTVLLSFPTGHSCVAATGEGWQFTPKKE
jgi:hypothetical protein